MAPLNFKREDERIYHFLDTVGTNAQRDSILAFQRLCFDRKDELVSILDRRAAVEGYHWSFGVEKAIEYYILEYSFAFWQWGIKSFADIPTDQEESEYILDHLLEVSGLSFFEESGVEQLRPFFWAALTEIGMYGYRTEPYEEYLGTDQPYLFDFSAPKGTQPVYNPEPMRQVNEYIQQSAERMMFIYGGLDTWGATGVRLTDEAKKRDNYVMILPNGYHGTRIGSFSPTEQAEILKILLKWAGIEP